MKIACIIPTLNAGKAFASLLNNLKKQNVNADILVVDSGSSDETLKVAHKLAFAVQSISISQFNHGATRQMMINLYPKYDFYVFLTQDVSIFDDNAIKNLITPFLDSTVGAVYGRQLPHTDANCFAQHARFFNYPAFNVEKSLILKNIHGIKTVFISNSFAAYRANALNEIGGFPSDVILGEDMLVGAKMILSGYKLFYNSNALCRHSHNYSIIEEFRRYFDTGVFHSRESWIKLTFGNAGGEGLRYVISELKFIGIRNPFLCFFSLTRNFLKYFAFRIGCHEKYIPSFVKKKISMNFNYWLSKI